MINHGKDIAAAQLAEDYRKYPIDEHGKLRFAYGKVTTSSVLAANGTMALLYLPVGRKRILPHLSYITVSAFGAGRTLNLGHAAYTKAMPFDQESENAVALIDGLKVASGASAQQFSNVLKYDMYSLGKVLLFATVVGGTTPSGATVEAHVAYTYE